MAKVPSEAPNEPPVLLDSDIRFKRFPFFWIPLLLIIVVGSRYVGVTQDVINTITLFSLPVGILGLAIWAFLFGNGNKRILLLLGILPLLFLGSFFAMIELENNGDMAIVGWKWRWQDSKDRQLEALEVEAADNNVELLATPRDYPGFLGGNYWAEVANVELEDDWQSHPPRLLWKQDIGAGWSGFAIVANYAITQEQRNDQELVTCYHLTTGEVVWTHKDDVRWDPGGFGALGYFGPRATPTIHQGLVYSQGATGILNCLNGSTGVRIWSRDTLAENNIENILWGKACSPLIVEREDQTALVVVSVGAGNGRSLIAYEATTGEEIWAAGDHRSSYASPVQATLCGVEQILVVNENFVTAHQLEDGQVLWEHPWEGNSDSNASVSQPIPLAGDRVFLSKGYGIGSQLLQLTGGDGNPIRTESIWKKTCMKTKMGNVLVRDDYVYGLDGGILQCIEFETGRKRWKKRRRPKDIGHGQLLLLGDAILALSESGEVLLIEANPKKFRELASMQVFAEDVNTWNNPAFAPPYLLIRNAEEAACYELPIKAHVEAELAQKK